jgi:predicted DNA-binding transcriptional regulator AlpA
MSYENNNKTANLTGDKLLRVEIVAEQLGISDRGVWRGVARGDLPAPVKIGRCSRWFASDVLAYQDKLRNIRNN